MSNQANQGTSWVDPATEIVPHVVKISSPDSSGSGFYIAYRMDKKQKIACIATAYHVIDHALKWKEPLRITGHKETTATLMPDQYDIMANEDLDLAVLEVLWESVDFPELPLRTVHPKQVLFPGMRIGWSGYPNIVNGINCFISGYSSACIAGSGDYLIDGVVIHGVSGCPAYIYDGKEIMIIGLLSQYFPNRENGDSLPGLGLVKNISPISSYFDKHTKAVSK